MKSKLLVIFPLIIAIGMGACSNELKNENRKMKAEIIQLQKKSDDLKKSFNDISKKYSKKNDNVRKQIAKIKVLTKGEELIKYDIFPIYYMDMEVDSIESESYISILKEKELVDKLKAIAEELSKKCFLGYPIEILNIENIEDKKIAYVNLINKKDSKRREVGNWYNQFFNKYSSTISSSILIESFLQREYEGKWIDGIKFLYEGVNPEFQDVPSFSSIKYRNILE